jgi:hypothetical protein
MKVEKIDKQNTVFAKAVFINAEVNYSNGNHQNLNVSSEYLVVNVRGLWVLNVQLRKETLDGNGEFFDNS